MCFSCGFLVSVLWTVFVQSFVLFLASLLRLSFRFSPRPPFRLSSRFSFRSSACISPRPSVRFLVSFISFGRVGWAVRGTRRFCRLFVAGVGLSFFWVSMPWWWCGGVSLIGAMSVDG